MAKDTFKRGTRDSFFEALFSIAKQDRNVLVITADNGAPSLDRFRIELPSQLFTVGIAEQNMVAVAAGLALSGKKPYIYAIAPFVTLRCFEQLKVDACAMNLPITALGVGAGLSYDIMGPTHHTTEDLSIMRALPGMVIYTPSDSVMAAAMAALTYSTPGPKYIRFDREVFLSLYNDPTDFSPGLTSLREGQKVCMIATGIMVHTALRVAEKLSKTGLNPGVIDLYRAAPINDELLKQWVAPYEIIVTLEEHFLIGGIGDAVRASLVGDSAFRKQLYPIGLPHAYLFEYGGRQNLHELTGLDDVSLCSKISEIVKNEIY